MLAVTALGDLAGSRPVTRSGARPGDVIAVAGTLGCAAAGLALLRAGVTPADEDLASLVAAHRRPAPPYQAGPEAAELGATAMIDVSDGLIADLGHVASASGVQIELRTGAIGAESVTRRQALVRAAEVLGAGAGAVSGGRAGAGADWQRWVLTGGDDHALVAAFPPGISLPERWTVIGKASEGHGIVVDGRRWNDGAGGWEHFLDLTTLRG